MKKGGVKTSEDGEKLTIVFCWMNTKGYFGGKNNERT